MDAQVCAELEGAVAAAEGVAREAAEEAATAKRDLEAAGRLLQQVCTSTL